MAITKPSWDEKVKRVKDPEIEKAGWTYYELEEVLSPFLVRRKLCRRKPNCVRHIVTVEDVFREDCPF